MIVRTPIKFALVYECFRPDELYWDKYREHYGDESARKVFTTYVEMVFLTLLFNDLSDLLNNSKIEELSWFNKEEPFVTGVLEALNENRKLKTNFRINSVYEINSFLQWNTCGIRDCAFRFDAPDDIYLQRPFVELGTLTDVAIKQLSANYNYFKDCELDLSLYKRHELFDWQKDCVM